MINGKAILINFLIIAVYMGILSAAYGSRILTASMFPIAAHAFTNFILFLVYLEHENKALPNSFLISALIILLVGFTSCWGLPDVLRRNN